MKEEDIDGAIATVQEAFAEDPYNKWIYNVRENVNTPCNPSLPNNQQEKRLTTTTVLSNP
jgi:hypothetical protein